MKPLYTAEITARGGRKGDVKSNDNNLQVRLATPAELGGDGSAGTNPEQLFAGAYGACFLTTIVALADKDQISLKEPKIIVKVSIHRHEKNGDVLSAALNVVEESLPEDVLSDLVRKAHQLCPYARATRGNIETVLTANKIDVEL